MVRPRLSSAPAAPCTRPCSCGPAALLTSVLSVALQKPMPSAARHQRRDEHRHRVGQRARCPADCSEHQPAISVRRAPNLRDNRSNEKPLHHHTQRTECAEQIARVRCVEAEAPRAEERECRLVNREGHPVQEVHAEQKPETRPSTQLTERFPR